MIVLDDKEPSKGEDGTPWFVKISTWQIFGLFCKCAVFVASAGALVFMCHLGSTYYQTVSKF